MRTFLHWPVKLGGLVLWLLAGPVLAQETAPFEVPAGSGPEEARTPNPGPAPCLGQVLILDNERLLEGRVERHGDQYCLRQAQGEVWLPAARVLKVCTDRAAAFAFMASRTNRQDPDERLRLARWCQLNGLYEQALAEARAALALRPQHTPSRQLVEVLEHLVSSPPARTSPPNRPEMPPPPALDVSPESFNMFITKVQPVLMNACSQCHVNGRGGRFQLMRVYGAGAPNRQAVQQNLAAVLAQVDLRRPELSPLLIKALSAHGNCTQPPLRGRESPPYRMLRSWLELTRATNPHLLQSPSAGLAAGTGPSGASSFAQPPDDLPTVPTGTPPPTIGTMPHSAPPASGGASPSKETNPAGMPPTRAPLAATPGAVSLPTAPPVSANPEIATPAPPAPDAYDPEEFNRQQRR
jgi:hypothetical protein